jgi:anti-anti-sigma regulatory factor
MTLRIERVSNGAKTMLRISGRIAAQNLAELHAEIDGKGKHTVLDLEHVTLVDVDGVRFLNECVLQGMELAHCSPYIREWMEREREN